MSNSENWKATELWLTAIVGVVNTILGSTANDSVTSCLMICLTATAVSYIICRTVFKIFKLKHRPDEVVNFSTASEEHS